MTFVLAVVHCSVNVEISSSSSVTVRLHGTLRSPSKSALLNGLCINFGSYRISRCT